MDTPGGGGKKLVYYLCLIVSATIFAPRRTTLTMFSSCVHTHVLLALMFDFFIFTSFYPFLFSLRLFLSLSRVGDALLTVFSLFFVGTDYPDSSHLFVIYPRLFFFTSCVFWLSLHFAQCTLLVLSCSYFLLVFSLRQVSLSENFPFRSHRVQSFRDCAFIPVVQSICDMTGDRHQKSTKLRSNIFLTHAFPTIKASTASPNISQKASKAPPSRYPATTSGMEWTCTYGIEKGKKRKKEGSTLDNGLCSKRHACETSHTCA